MSASRSSVTKAAIAALALAAAALLALLLAPLGVSAGLWDFRLGFTLLRWAVYLGLTGVVVALFAIVWGWRARGPSGAALPILALALALLAASIPLAQYRKAKILPPINDITTDPTDPPTFEKAGAGAENGAAGVAYPAAEFAEQQRQAYPDLRTLEYEQRPAAVFRAALQTAREMPGWEVLVADSAGGRIEATATTTWFRFKDDVSVRVRPSDGGAELDVRSRSRVGRSDVGANAERIRDYTERLEERLREIAAADS